MRQLTMTSLFDGIGGFCLAGQRNGIKTLQVSEIEPYPIAVSKAHFPDAEHLGSITELNGAELEPVDIITFGSPCQDLSVAGKQAGIHEGARSSLFFQAVRIIKEMRDKDIASGRSNQSVRPRFAVWENVPGAFSSNHGRDFQAVLQAFCEIRGGSDHIVPLPPNGRWLPAGCVVGNGWSLAWRILDAQFWGVPQRRKRIFLVADFAGERAGEILFIEHGLRRDSSQGAETGKGTAADAERSAGRSSGGSVQCLNPWDCESKLQYEIDGVYRTLDAGNGAGGQAHGVCYSPAAFMDGQGAKAGSIAYTDDGSTPTLKSAPSGGNTVPDVVYPINTMVATRGGKDDGRTTFGVGEPNDPQFTLSSAHEHGVCYAIEGNVVDRNAKQNGMGVSEDTSPSLNTQDKHAVCFKQDGFADYREGVGTLKASGGDVGGGTESIVIQRARGNGDGGVAPTVCSHPKGGVHDYEPLCVQKVFENHSQDTRWKGPVDISQTVSATFGMGGNNQPFVVKAVEDE